MALAITVDKLLGIPDNTDKELVVQGVITFSGSYVTGGDPLSFANNNRIQSRALPLMVEVYEEPIAGTQTATGFDFVYAKGTTQANGTLQIIGPGTTGTPAQLAAGAYPAALTTPTTTVKFRAYFPLGN
jgi:hypothetical protein